MRTNGAGFLCLIALAAAAIGVIATTLPPTPQPADAPAQAFSAERAIRHIQVIAQGPHPTGSAANEEVRAYLLAELEALGLETETQPAGDLVNVLGRIPGARSMDAVLLTAHLDSTLQSPGATDDGAGVAIMLETARALAAGAPLRNTVMFLFTDHEEGGFFGAKAFIAQHPWAKEVKVAIGLDAGGVRGPAVLSATSPENGWLIRQLAQADPYLVGSSAINALAYSSTDFGRAFKPAGFSGYAFDIYWDKRDGPEDNLANLNPPSLQHQGSQALALARHFGGLVPLADPKEPDAVFFNVLQLFTIHYSPILAILIALGVTGVFFAVLVFGLRRSLLTWRGMGYGSFVLLVGLVASSLPAIVLETIVGRWAPGVTSAWDHRILDQPPQMSAIALASLGLTVLWVRLARRIRKTSLPDLTLGALLPMTVGMDAAAAAFPALSYGFTWPLLFSLLAVAIWFSWSGRRKESRMVLLGLLVSGAATVVVAGPAVLLGLFDQLSLALASLGALCGFLVPQIHLMLGGALDDQVLMQGEGEKLIHE